MKFRKIVLWIWMLGMLGSATATFYLGIKALSVPTPKIVESNLSKVLFEKNEWQNFIDSKGEIDQNIFINTFLRKIASQGKIKSIKFEFDKQKAIVSIVDFQTQYKWFYNLV